MRNLLRPVIVVASLATVLGLIGCENGDDAEGTQNANAENSGDMGLDPANDGSGESVEDVGMGGSLGTGGHSANDPCEGAQGPFCGDS